MSVHIEYMKSIAEDMTPVSSARICAVVLDRKGNVLSVGVNQAKSHPMQAQYGKNEHAIYLHAEIDAIKNALKKIGRNSLRQCTMLICRRKFNENGEFIYGLAKPCDGCVKAIQDFGIKEVIYTLDGDSSKVGQLTIE